MAESPKHNHVSHTKHPHSLEWTLCRASLRLFCTCVQAEHHSLEWHSAALSVCATTPTTHTNETHRHNLQAIPKKQQNQRMRTKAQAHVGVPRQCLLQQLIDAISILHPLTMYMAGVHEYISVGGM